MWGRGQKGNNATCLALALLSVTSLSSCKWIVPFQLLISGLVGLCMFQDPISPSNRLSCEIWFLMLPHSPLFYSQRFWGLFPALEPWVAWSVSLPSCSSLLVCTRMWDIPVHQPPPCALSSLPLLPVCVNVSFLTPWLSDFHTVQLSGSSGCFCLFVFKFVVLLLVVRVSKVYLPMPPSWLEALYLFLYQSSGG